ncbi:c-type cytochrome [Zavarzinia compransoris]|uniref:Cytochrome C556 n=1 Tax=Zavarzinia compransoris TaxID=1264899 RepID=A0A317E8D6_9PROT|nr:cytochrome c [Zavarzinia compransoris]PWR23418.1 cytochrome C556 [Zavarzinia compransoris]TDP46006.1 cytochrome c556 [Zavarzinia compransoris]
MALLALHRSRWTVALALTLGLSGAALAAGAEALVEQREAGMKQAGGALKALGAAAKAGAVTPADVEKAQGLADFATALPTLFPEGSITDKSRALPEIWTDKAGWDAKVKVFADAADAILVAAKAGDVAGLRAGVGAAGDSCGACHKAFRGPEKD